MNEALLWLCVPVFASWIAVLNRQFRCQCHHYSAGCRGAQSARHRRPRCHLLGNPTSGPANDGCALNTERPTAYMSLVLAT